MLPFPAVSDSLRTSGLFLTQAHLPLGLTSWARLPSGQPVERQDTGSCYPFPASTFF